MGEKVLNMQSINVFVTIWQDRKETRKYRHTTREYIFPQYYNVRIYRQTKK